MTILVTGAAGFIGYHVCQKLLARGESVLGIDNLNNYYDVNLKKARLAQLTSHKMFEFKLIDIANQQAMQAFKTDTPNIDRVVHLAAQAGVRYSLVNPHIYAESNVMGHLNILEACRAWAVQHLVYARSSSVSGANQKLPVSVHDPVDHPMSLYAATKRCDELFSSTYSHLFGIPATGLRFFTVYGPWGRPDMAAFLFTKALLEEKPLTLFNQGDMRRNFTYIDDIVAGVLACLDKPPAASVHEPRHRIYNIGNDRSASLMDFMHTLERLTGKKAQIHLDALQPGDVKETIADITETTRDFGFKPTINIEEGLQQFINWYKAYYA